MTLLRGNGEVLYKTSFNLSLSDVLLIITLGLGFWKKNAPEVKCLRVTRCQEVSLDIIGDLHLHHLVQVVAARFLHCAIPPPFF